LILFGELPGELCDGTKIAGFCSGGEITSHANGNRTGLDSFGHIRQCESACGHQRSLPKRTFKTFAIVTSCQKHSILGTFTAAA
jgi:hypothetical protein